MILFPAIDLKDGTCVRLLRGDMDAATVFNDNPANQAQAFVDAGTSWLHMVDLNGAFDGASVNGAAVRAILDGTRAAGVQVQLGGGIRTREQVAAWLDDGVDRVILGTAAVKDPDLVISSCREYPGRIVVVQSLGEAELHMDWSLMAGEGIETVVVEGDYGVLRDPAVEQTARHVRAQIDRALATA